MTKFIIRRLGATLITLLVISLLVFIFSRMIGDPVMMYLDPTATQEDRRILAASMGLDKPLPTQYIMFLGRLILHGDLGESLSENQPVTKLFFSRVWNTFQLGLVSFVMTMLISLPAGVLAAIRRATWWDWIVRGFVFVGQSVPNFWMGLMLILVFAVRFRILPPAMKGGPSTYVLPAITLGWYAAAGVTRMVRSAMLETMSSDYVRTARAKGLSETLIIVRHELRNALIPVVAFSGLLLVRSFIIGSIVVETIFAWPGVGRLAYDATLARDFPAIQGIVLLISALVLTINLITDIAYGWLDPRIRYS